MCMDDLVMRNRKRVRNRNTKGGEVVVVVTSVVPKQETEKKREFSSVLHTWRETCTWWITSKTAYKYNTKKKCGTAHL